MHADRSVCLLGMDRHVRAIQSNPDIGATQLRVVKQTVTAMDAYDCQTSIQKVKPLMAGQLTD